MKKVLGIATLTGLGLLTYVYWPVSYDHLTNYPPAGTHLVAFGDSLIAGVGATTGNDFVSRLGRELRLPIINYGRSGDTTADALNRLKGVLDERPDIAIVLVGGNDALKRIPMTKTEDQLERIVIRFQEGGALVVLLAVRGGLLGDPYDSMYERVAEKTGSLLVPDVLDGLFGDREFMSDTVHPNDAGYAIIAERVGRAIRPLLP